MRVDKREFTLEVLCKKSRKNFLLNFLLFYHSLSYSYMLVLMSRTSLHFVVLSSFSLCLCFCLCRRLKKRLLRQLSIGEKPGGAVVLFPFSSPNLPKTCFIITQTLSSQYLFCSNLNPVPTFCCFLLMVLTFPT